MDILFPRTFLLVFAQLSVGGLFCLSIPPFHDMERGYYKSSAFVFAAIGTLAALGHFLLWLRPSSAAGGLGGVEVALWCLYSVLAGAYLASLWYEYVIIRARLFSAAWISGFVALTASATSFASASTVPLAYLVYPLSFAVAALVLGTAGSGMLLGHWYLIDRDLSLAPLWRVLRFYGACLALQLLLLIGAAAIAAWSDSGLLWDDYRWVFLGRLAISPLGTAALAFMIWRTLLIPQTMAATGLFYIAVLGATVGELVGRYLLFRTGLPV